MIQVGDRCCKNLLCAKSSQFSHVYVSPCPFQINDNNSIPTGKCLRGRSYLQNLNLLKLMVFSWIQKYQSRAKVWFFFFFFGPCYYHGDNLKISFEFAYNNHLPFTIFSHLRKTTHPTGLRDPRAVCSPCDPVILMSRPTHFAWLPPVSVQQHLASWEDPWRPHTHIQSWLSTMVLCTNRKTSSRKCTKIVMMIIFRRWSCVWFLFHFSIFSKGSITSSYYFYKKKL